VDFHDQRVPMFLSSEVRCVEQNAHETATDQTCNRDSHDPGEDQETNSLPVDSLQSAVAETNADGGTRDAHRRRDRQRVL